MQAERLQIIHFHVRGNKSAVTFTSGACTECYQAVCSELVYYQVTL